MKVIGIILIVLQVMGLLGGGFPTTSGGVLYQLFFYVGYFLPGIIGVILLNKAGKKKKEE